MSRFFAIAVSMTTAVLCAGPAAAGSQLLCRTYEIGAEPSLPWSSDTGWGQPRRDYPRDQVVDDTLRLLAPDRPVIARMETLRRATMYVSDHPELAGELLSRLMARVLQAESSKDKNALAWFDAGYLAATFETSHLSRKHRSLALGLDGYALVRRALEARPDPEMEFAAAIIRYESPEKPGPHLRRAYEQAQPGSPLARNLAATFGHRRPAKAAAR